MTTKNISWGGSEHVAFFQHNTVDNTCPWLKLFLALGTTVLDVGCGPGTITLDVARRVRPGFVTGVDSNPEMIQQARTSTAEVGITNATFQVGEAHRLDFEDETFDLTYGMNILGWLDDPVAALREWRRVTRCGGWVVTAAGDLDHMVWYPDSPALVRFYEALLIHLKRDFHYRQGRQMVELFAQAGFAEVRVEIGSDPKTCVHPGSVYFGWWVEEFGRVLGLVPESDRFRASREAMAPELVGAARAEFEAWRRHPYAFYATVQFMAAGRVA